MAGSGADGKYDAFQMFFDEIYERLDQKFVDTTKNKKRLDAVNMKNYETLVYEYKVLGNHEQDGEIQLKFQFLGDNLYGISVSDDNIKTVTVYDDVTEHKFRQFINNFFGYDGTRITSVNKRKLYKKSRFGFPQGQGVSSVAHVAGPQGYTFFIT